MYSFDGRIRYSETDNDENITIPAIIDYFQDAAIFHTMDAGAGIGTLLANNCAWMVCAWQIEILRYPKHGERVVVSTWPYSFRHFMGERNCVLATPEGEQLILANCIWTFVDIKEGKPKIVPDEIIGLYELGKPLEMEYKGRKIILPKEDGEELCHIMVEKQHIDSLNHVNNGQYVKMALALRQGKKPVKSVRVEYKNQAHLGDIIKPVRYIADDREIIALMSEDNVVYSVIELL